MYPTLTWDALAAKYNGEAQAQLEFDIAKRILSGLEQPSFDLANVFTHLRTGMAIFQRYMVLTDSEFSDRFKFSAEGTEGISRIPDLLQVDGNSTAGTIVQHPDHPYRTLELFSVNENLLQTIALSASALARPKQAAEHYNSVREQVVAGRHNVLQGLVPAQSLDEVTKLVATSNAKKEAQQAADVAKLNVGGPASSWQRFHRKCQGCTFREANRAIVWIACEV